MPEIKIDARDQLRSALENGVPTAEMDTLLDSIDSAELLHAMFRLDPDEPMVPFNLEMNESDFTQQALRRKGKR